MHDGGDRPKPSAGDPTPRHRPPYGMSMRRRVRPARGSDSFTRRRCATPTPPTGSTLRVSGHLTRLVLIVGFLACAALGIWSSSWDTDGSSQRQAATRPSPSPATTYTPPSSQPTPSAASSTALSSNRGGTKSKKPRQVKRAGTPRQQVENVRGEARRQPARAAERRTTRSKPPFRGSNNRGATRGLVAKCDDLFPPSPPKFRLRNQVCRLLLGG